MSQHFVGILIFGGALSCAQCQLSYAHGVASFPVVDNATQRARDADRRHILETELHIERRALVRAQAVLASESTQERAADVHRHTKNIRSLRRELDTVAKLRPALRESAPALVKAERTAVSPDAGRISIAPLRSMKGPAAYWNPYNRAPDREVGPEVEPELTADLPTIPRREAP